MFCFLATSWEGKSQGEHKTPLYFSSVAVMAHTTTLEYSTHLCYPNKYTTEPSWSVTHRCHISCLLLVNLSLQRFYGLLPQKAA